jgi:hypothetical protein
MVLAYEAAEVFQEVWLEKAECAVGEAVAEAAEV